MIQFNFTDKVNQLIFDALIQPEFTYVCKINKVSNFLLVKGIGYDFGLTLTHSRMIEGIVTSYTPGENLIVRDQYGNNVEFHPPMMVEKGLTCLNPILREFDESLSTTDDPIQMGNLTYKKKKYTLVGLKANLDIFRELLFTGRLNINVCQRNNNAIFVGDISRRCPADILIFGPTLVTNNGVIRL